MFRDGIYDFARKYQSAGADPLTILSFRIQIRVDTGVRTQHAGS